MTMPLNQAQQLVNSCLEHVRKVSPNMMEAQIVASGLIIASLTEVQARVVALIAGGYRLDLLRSTLLLCNEAIRMQQDVLKLQGNQKSRLLQLAAGLNEVR